MKHLRNAVAEKPGENRSSVIGSPTSLLMLVARAIFLTAFVLAQPDSLDAQQKYPALTNVITFEDLLKAKQERSVEWINPNGVREKMTFTEIRIPVDRKIINLTREFIRATYGRDSIVVRPQMIVFHAMGDGDLRTSLVVSSFLNDQMPESWGILSRAGLLPNGAHFIIDKSGEVFCLTPPTSPDKDQVSYERDRHAWLIRRHQDGNPVAIGIENVTDPGNYTGLTRQQIESNARLARWLIWLENKKIIYLASHHQFNDDSAYDLFLTKFGLTNRQKKYRTRGRKDIGDANLRDILGKVNLSGYAVQPLFGLK